MNIRSTALLVALLLSNLLFSASSYAEEDQFIGGGTNACLAVYPCDENGDLFPLLDDESSACYEYYAAQCYKAKRDLLKSCETAKKRLQRKKKRGKRS